MNAAVTEFHEALRLDPNFVEAHRKLATALRAQGKLGAAITEFRAAVRLEPGNALGHHSLGKVLKEQGELDEAIAEYHAAIRLKADYSEAHVSLGAALALSGELDQAIEEFRAAIRLSPKNAEAHCNLGMAFREQARFDEALAELRIGHELGSKKPNWRQPSAEWVRSTARLVELDRKLSTVLAGTVKPSDAAETLEFARLCNDKKLHGASARFWSDAFQAQPKLAEDMQEQNRYDAACSAALAGSGQSKDNPPLDNAVKSRWRKQAIDWLKADLVAWSKVLANGPPEAQKAIPDTLEHWKSDTDLAGLREAAALGKLNAEEQKACRALWAEVDALLAKCKDGNPVDRR